MKKIISITLIFILSAQCLYRLGIFTYFQLNREYIAEVLCINKEKPITMCYGKCFLDRNIERADDSENSTLPPAGNEKLEIPVFVVSESLYSFHPEAHYILANTDHHQVLAEGFSKGIFHPPSLV